MVELNLQADLKLGDTPRCLELRKKMIDKQIRARGIHNPLVLKAMEMVPRHRFVDERLESAAYDDTPLPIGENQTISQPYIVAYMTAALELKGCEKVLEVGMGSGYQAAVLSVIVAHVFTIEINENLAIETAQRLKKMGYSNISIRYGDGYAGWPERAPFDGIVVTAAAHHIPGPLVEQLKIGGKMVIPVGEAYQDLIVATKLSDGSIKKESRLPVRFVPMSGEAEKRN
ncbi:MAG: protein-L-isoaspartate(D-aspartate) O-methyltransferase [bacterium]